MLVKTIALFLFGLGVFILMQVFMPLIAFKTWELFAYDASQALADPNPGSLSPYQTNSPGFIVENINNFPAFISQDHSGNISFYQEFKLSIPKIDINGVKVLVRNNNFEETLAHLPGSALPGEKGNVFITGHSSLSAILSSDRRKAYFVNLPKIRKGDEILVEALGQEFSYVVEGLKIVDPKDTSVINPPDSEGRYLSLMTCVPPGFNSKRLIVLAKLR